MKNTKREITLRGSQCRAILRGEEVKDSETSFTFNLITDMEGELFELEDGRGVYYQREGTGICLEQTTKVKYKFDYTESGRHEDDMSCYCSGFLTEVK